MALSDEWKKIRTTWDQRSKPSGGAKPEKPVAAFESKYLKGIDSAVKAADAALAKKDEKALSKVDAGFSKLLLDTKVAGKKVVTELTALKVPANRIGDVKSVLEILDDRLDHLKSLLAAERSNLKNPGPRPSTEIVPEAVFTQLRATPITRDPRVMKFAGDKKYRTRLSNGEANWAEVTKHQDAFARFYAEYVAALKGVDTVKTSKGTAAQVGGALNQLFAKLNDGLFGMSTAIHEWASHQEDDMKHSQPPIDPRKNVTWSEIEAVVRLFPTESDRVERLRVSVKKLLPQHIKP